MTKVVVLMAALLGISSVATGHSNDDLVAEIGAGRPHNGFDLSIGRIRYQYYPDQNWARMSVDRLENGKPVLSWDLGDRIYAQCFRIGTEQGRNSCAIRVGRVVEGRYGHGRKREWHKIGLAGNDLVGPLSQRRTDLEVARRPEYDSWDNALVFLIYLRERVRVSTPTGKRYQWQPRVVTHVHAAASPVPPTIHTHPTASPLGARWLVPFFPGAGVLRVLNQESSPSPVTVSAYDGDGNDLDVCMTEEVAGRGIKTWKRRDGAFGGCTDAGVWSVTVTGRSGAQLFVSPFMHREGVGYSLLPAVIQAD